MYQLRYSLLFCIPTPDSLDVKELRYSVHENFITVVKTPSMIEYIYIPILENPELLRLLSRTILYSRS